MVRNNAHGCHDDVSCILLSYIIQLQLGYFFTNFQLNKAC